MGDGPGVTVGGVPVAVGDGVAVAVPTAVGWFADGKSAESPPGRLLLVVGWFADGKSALLTPGRLLLVVGWLAEA